MQHINNGSLMKVQKLLESGLDPNFITDDGGKVVIHEAD